MGPQTTSVNSHGLGLWIAKNLAEAHGGRIEVQSDGATGTAFRVELPQR